MFILNFKPLLPNTPFTTGEGENLKQYPANWLTNASIEERLAIGITEISNSIRPDDRFYFVSDNPDGTHSFIPRDLDQLKESFIKQVKGHAVTTLSHTDWYVIRSLDPTDGKVIPDQVLSERTAIKAKVIEIETDITAAKDVDQLALINLAIVLPEVDDTVTKPVKKRKSSKSTESS